MPSSPEYRFFVFTINNWDDSSHQFLSDFATQCEWMIYGEEKAPSTGTPHLQGALFLKCFSTKLKMVRRFKKASAWVSQATDSKKHPQYWAEYCSKEQTNVTVYGTQPSNNEYLESLPKGQGHRTDIKSTYSVLKTGMNLRTFVKEKEPNLQCIKIAETYMKYCEPERSTAFAPKVVWIFGPSGSGKTRYVYDQHPDMPPYRPVSAKWWDGYDGHGIVLLDEVRPEEWPLSILLKVIDRYPLRVECKGGSRQLKADIIYITSNIHPSLLYQHTSEDMKQIERRVTEFIEMKHPE